MSRIYEALRKHELEQRQHTVQQPRPQPRLLVPAPAPATVRPEVYRTAVPGEREMRALHHSLESALGPVEGAPIVMFASAHPGEGKTTVAGALATLLSWQMGRSVAVL